MDLDFFPVQHQGQQLILVRDHLGLVQEGKALPIPLYQFMALLNGRSTLRDLQMELMRQKGGVLVGKDEVEILLAHLDESFLLDSERFKTARDRLVADFSSQKVRPPSHSGLSYPEDPLLLKKRLDEILEGSPHTPKQEGKIVALVSPHIDLGVGHKVYSSAYQMLRHVAPSRVLLLGVGHHMMKHLFSLTDKAFETPLGRVESEPPVIHDLQKIGGDIVAPDDFSHRSEHSIEFQVIFLQHMLPKGSFTIMPVLCGPVQSTLPEYSRNAYLDQAGSFLQELKRLAEEPDRETLIVAGVDFSHIGPKFGHEMPAGYLKNQAEAHDTSLLKYLSELDAKGFWQESRKEKDQFNVCGFSALACLLEILPPSEGRILDYEIWHEEATRSSVSFSAMAFTGTDNHERMDINTKTKGDMS